MAISKEEYNRLKPYWDFQRKKEYNREQLEDAIEEVKKRTGLTILSFDEIWSRLEEKEYQEVPNNWVPRDPKWRIQGE